MIKAVIFDFGGVLADEGFRKGLLVIGQKHGLNPEAFFRIAEELIYETGYVSGTAGEPEFWKALREKTGIKGSDKKLWDNIFKQFQLNEEMIGLVKTLKASGFVTAILSDQTNWLDEINEKTPFFHHFDYVFNSYHLKKSKKDPSVFRDVCLAIGLKPDEALFVDDHGENTERAQKAGLKSIQFRNAEDLKKKIQQFTDQVPGKRGGWY
jgi:putative hydrolase of the HAD superfamily